MRKNIVFVMADQFRYDAISKHDNSYISTPTFDQWINEGYDFTNCYSATPTCIPARASLLSGLSQENTGMVGYEEGANWNFPHQLGKEFANRRYYAKAIGKMHVSNPRKRMGFHHVELHDGYLHATRKSYLRKDRSYISTDDYYNCLKENLGNDADIIDNGLECNSWVAREFNYEEKYHPTNWVVSRAIDFLRKRDTTEPFFLYMSFVRPHSPYDPPRYYFDMYMDELKDIKKRDLSKRARDLGLDKNIDKIDALTGSITERDYRRMLAGYFGSVTHIDHQLNRFMIKLNEYDLLEDTIFVFTSDHGDMLADHNLYRKGFAYQGSTHIPLIVYDPGENIFKKEDMRKKIDNIVELRDILPSLVDFATGEKVENIDGVSVKSLMKKDYDDTNWRKVLHGEHVLGEFSNQFILKLPYKYIWYTQSGIEQLFDIQKDPTEDNNLIDDENYKDIADNLRNILIDNLKEREEGFVKDNKLIKGVKQKPLLSINEKYKD